MPHVFAWWSVAGAVEPTTGDRFVLEWPSRKAEGVQICRKTFAAAVPDSQHAYSWTTAGPIQPSASDVSCGGDIACCMASCSQEGGFAVQPIGASFEALLSSGNGIREPGRRQIT